MRGRGILLHSLSLNVVFLLLLLVISSNAWAANSLKLEWEKTVGSARADRGYSAIPTADGSYVVVGESLSNSVVMQGKGGLDIYLVKVSGEGYHLWYKRYGDKKDDRGNSIYQTNDGGFVITGFTYSNADFDNSGKQVYLVKTDADGDKQWSSKYGGDGDDTGTRVVQASDGGYVVIGETNSFGAGGYDVYLTKTGADGKKQWEKTYGGKEDDHGLCVLETPDGGYILAGKTFSFKARGYDLYLIKTDPAGNVEWQRTVGGGGWDIPEDVALTNDGGYIVVGQTSSTGNGNFDVYLVKTDAGGNLEWEKTIGGNGWDAGKTVHQNADGGYTVAGFSDSFGEGGFEFYMFRTDDRGNKLNEETLSEGIYDDKFSLQPTGDGGYIVAGWWLEPMEPDRWKDQNEDIYVAKITPVLPASPRDNNDGVLSNEADALVDSVLISDGRILVPYRPLAEALGAKVEWTPGDGTVTMSTGKNKVVLKIGSTEALVNNQLVEIDVSAVIFNDQTYVPLRFAVESLGAEVIWDNENKTVNIVTE